MGASRLHTLRLATATHSSRCLEALPLFKRCEWLVINCNVGKRTPLEINNDFLAKNLIPLAAICDLFGENGNDDDIESEY